MLMAVFTLSSSFWVLAKGLFPSWSLEAFSAPLRPSVLVALPLCPSFPWFERPSRPLCALPPLCLLPLNCSGCSWGNTFPGALPSPPVCPATRHVQQATGMSLSSSVQGILAIRPPDGEFLMVEKRPFTCLSGVQHSKCSGRVCWINEVNEFNQIRSPLSEYQWRAGMNSVEFPTVNFVHN